MIKGQHRIDYMREYNKKYREKNREKLDQYRLNNKEKYRLYNSKWIKDNQERYNESKYKYRASLKAEVINHYSNGSMSCLKCGASDLDVLCLDHINNDGAIRRKEMKISSRGCSSGYNTYERVKSLGFPEGLQVLCANCNLKKEIERKRENRGKDNRSS